MEIKLRWVAYYSGPNRPSPQMLFLNLTIADSKLNQASKEGLPVFLSTHDPVFRNADPCIVLGKAVCDEC